MRRLCTQILWLLIVGVVCGPMFAADIVVIVNKNNPLTSISKKELKQIYLGKAKHFPNKAKVKPLNLERGGVRSTFEHKLFGRNQAALSRYWSKKIFAGKNLPPKTVKTPTQMIDQVVASQSSIGYVEAKDLDGSVKVILRLSGEDTPYTGVK